MIAHRDLRACVRAAAIVWLAFALVATLSTTAHCQLTVQGVYVDPDGVLRHRQTGTAKPFRPDAKQDSSTCCISLPRLFAELRRRTDAGESIPESMLNLDGLVKLHTIHVDPERRDLLIVGDGEEWETSNPNRPRGTRSGRPVLRLDDLVVALRSLGPGSRSRAFGCTLEQDPAAFDRVRELQPKVARIAVGGEARVAAALKEALGPLKAKTFGLPPDARPSLVCLEADYLMKRLSLELDRSPVAGVPSYIGQSTGKNVFSRFWFMAKYEPLLVSEDGNTFEIRGQGLQLRASDSPTQALSENPAARRFADDFTSHFPALEGAIPAFADLHNIADLAVVAALIAEDGLHEKAGWDATWALNTAGYRPAKVDPPKQAEALVNYRTKGNRTVTCAGGVEIDTQAALGKRESVRGEARGESGAPPALRASRPAIPREDWSVRVRSPEGATPGR